MENLASDYLTAKNTGVMSTLLSAERVKCCFVGEYKAGKTSIIRTYLDKSNENTLTTVGIDFFSKTLYVSNREVYLTIWDTAGSERFKSLTQSYLRDADLVVLVYDTTEKTSNVVYWMRCIEQYKPKVIGVLGNKTDLTYANEENMDDLLFPWSRQSIKVIHETLSARNKDDVKAFFKRCLKSIIDDQPEDFEMHYVQLEPSSPKNRTCCT